MLTRSALTVRLAGLSDLAAWQEFVDSMPSAGPLHHAGWYKILKAAFSVRPYFFFAIDETEKIVGILPTYHSRSPLAGNHLTSLEGGILAQSHHVEEVLL